MIELAVPIAATREIPTTTPLFIESRTATLKGALVFIDTFVLPRPRQPYLNGSTLTSSCECCHVGFRTVGKAPQINLRLHIFKTRRRPLLCSKFTHSLMEKWRCWLVRKGFQLLAQEGLTLNEENQHVLNYRNKAVFNDNNSKPFKDNIRKLVSI